jgi:hypothetical protein
VPSSETVVAEPPVHVSSITVPSVSDGSHFTAAKAALLLVDRSCAAPIEDKKRTADTSVTEDNFDIFVVFVLVFVSPFASHSCRLRFFSRNRKE